MVFSVSFLLVIFSHLSQIRLNIRFLLFNFCSAPLALLKGEKYFQIHPSFIETQSNKLYASLETC